MPFQHDIYMLSFIHVSQDFKVSHFLWLISCVFEKHFRCYGYNLLIGLRKGKWDFERSPGKFFTRFKRNSSTVDWLLFNKRKNLIILQFSHDFIKCNQIFMKIISLGFVWPLGWWKFILPHKKSLIYQIYSP